MERNRTGHAHVDTRVVSVVNEEVRERQHAEKPLFNVYTNDDWTKRKRVLALFTQSASKLILRFAPFSCSNNNSIITIVLLAVEMGSG